MHQNPKDTDNRNHIILTHNNDYSRNIVRLCERCVQNEKKVVLLTQHKMSNILIKPKSLQQLEHWLHIAFQDIESAPRRLIELYETAPRPDLIIFDMHSIIGELIGRPVLQQCRRDLLVGLIAKCAAAFCNYREMVDVAKHEQAKLSGIDLAVDTIVILPTEAYPMSPAQFKLLLGLYFCNYKQYTSFSQLSQRICVSQGLR